MVKVQTGPDTEDNTYSNWYKEVYVPQVEESAPVEPMETGE